MHATAASHRRAALALCGVLAASAVGPVRAQQVTSGSDGAAADEARDSAYEQAVQLAITEYERSNWEEAYVAFRQAYRARPGPRPLRGMGVALFEQRRYAEAIQVLERALSMRDDQRPLSDEHRAHVVRTLKQARSYAAQVELVTEPRGARVEVDGRLADDHTLILDSGRYRLRFAHDGYQPQEREIEVGLGDRRELRIELQPAGQALQDVAAAPQPAAGETGSGSALPVVGWIGVGLGVAALTTGVVVGALNASDYDALEKRCDAGECGEADRTEVESGRTRDGIATGLIIGGAVLSATGAVLLLWPSEEGDADADAARLTPVCSPRVCGLSASGRF